MGKAKKRIFNKITNDKGTTLKRNEVVTKILKNIKNNININKKEIEKLINMFGITEEELLEAGACYEEISAIKYIFL